jgi:hypothetical protein
MTISINICATVHCELCSNEIEVTLTEIFCGSGNAWDDRNVKSELERADWEQYNDGYICPGHENEIADEEKLEEVIV